jgi:phage terminase large subunit GpA-like protein
MRKLCAPHKYSLTRSLIGRGMAAVPSGELENEESSMHFEDIASSGLRSFLLPCPHCGHRMAITAIAPARLANGAESNDVQDVTHGCAHCGTTLIRTVRPFSGDANEIAPRV